MREILQQQNKPAWHGSGSFFLASVRDECGLTLDQWRDMSLAAREEKITLYRVKADMQKWESMSDEERRHLISQWRLSKHQEQNEERNNGRSS